MNCKHCGSKLQTFQWKGMHSSPKYYWCPKCELRHYIGGVTSDGLDELSSAAREQLLKWLDDENLPVPVINRRLS